MLILIAAVALLAVSALLAVYLSSSRKTLTMRTELEAQELPPPRFTASAFSEGYATVRNNEAGISATLPLPWRLDENEPDYLLRALFADRGATVFFDIRSEENPARLALADFARKTRPFDTFSPTLLNGRGALAARAKVAYDADSRGRPIPIAESARLVYLVPRGSAVVVASCSSVGAEYRQYEGTCESALQSITIEE
ncbi:MAG: hypothetical protein HY536_01025 [Candidatus Colwellbacteria bacterium]|nr:hypothetical protein [Candidatus Colwellbacteria bacterium]